MSRFLLIFVTLSITQSTISAQNIDLANFQIPRILELVKKYVFSILPNLDKLSILQHPWFVVTGALIQIFHTVFKVLETISRILPIKPLGTIACLGNRGISPLMNPVRNFYFKIREEFLVNFI